MRVLNKKQIVERYGADKYYEIQEWLHGDGAPTKDMLRRARTIMLGEDYEEPTQIDMWGNFTFHRDCFGYAYVVDSTHPEELIPAIYQYHNFGDRNNYIPDVR
jgi:hypothetical protein